MNWQGLALSVERRFLSDLSDLPKDAQRTVSRVLEGLRTSGFADVKPLKGEDGIYRIRCGDYRILCAQQMNWIHVYSIQHRQGVYRGRIATPNSLPATTAQAFVQAPLEQPIVESEDSLFAAETGTASTDLERERTDALLNWDGTLEGLERLESLGIPNTLLDPLLQQLAAGERRGRARAARDIRLVRDEVIDSFFEPLLGGLRLDHPIEELVLVSPWITAWESRTTFAGLCNFIRRRSVPTKVVTRPPQMKNHIDAVAALEALPSVEVSYLESLHAKFYVCDMAPFPISMLSSANSTQGSFFNNEIGVLVRGRGELEGFVRELQSLTTDLREMSAQATSVRV